MRPADMDGALCLFGVADGVTEAALRDALGSHAGQLRSCTLDGPLRRDHNAVVLELASHEVALDVKHRFHQAARRSSAAGESPLRRLCAGVDTLYNERSSRGKGQTSDRWLSLQP